MIVPRTALVISSSLFSLGMAVPLPAHAAETGDVPPSSGPAADAADTPAARASSDVQGLADIVVTAQRRSESLQRTPVAVSVITAEVLAKRAISSESDLQSTVPGLTVRSGNNSNTLNYAIRGQSIDTFSFSPPAVLPYINEVSVTTSGSSSFFDLQSVQVLKGPQGTLFGRNSTGGAVLFTTTKPSNDFTGYVTGRLGNYAQRYLEGAVNIPIVQDKVLLRVAGVLEHRNGFQHDTFDDRTYGTIKRQGIRGSLTLAPTEEIKNEFVIDYQHSGGSNTVPPVYNAYPLGFNNAPLAGNFFYSPALDSVFGPGAFAAYLAANPRAYKPGLNAFADEQRRRGPYRVSLDTFPFHRAHNLVITNVTTFDIGADTQLKNVFGYTNGFSEDGFDNDGTPYKITANDYKIKTKFISEEPQLVGKAIGGDLSYILGLYYAHQEQNFDYVQQLLDLSPLLPVTLQPVKFSTRTTSIAGYAQGTYDLSLITGISGLGVTAGARYTSEKVESVQLPGSALYNFNLLFPTARNKLSKTFKKPSWTIGVQEQLNSNLLLYVVTRRSFRSGGFNGSSAPLPGSASVGGTAFAPEIATDAEVGFKFQGRVADLPARLNVAAFTMTVKDTQRTAYAKIPQTGIVSALVVNIPEARVRGVEIDTQINPAHWLTLGGSLAYTDAKFTKNESVLFGVTNRYGPYPDTPKWSGTVYADASAALPDNLGTLSARGDVYAQSSFYFGSLANTIVPGTRLPGYRLVSLRIGVDDIRQTGVSVSGGVKNLFNKTYYTGGFPVGDVLALNLAGPGDRRTFFGELRYKW